MNRIQRRRTKGWKMPEGTVYIGRPSKFGNPFKLDADGFIMLYSINRRIFDPWIYWSYSSGFEIKDILELYEQWITGNWQGVPLPPVPDIEELRGKDLACWCPLSSACHGGVLIKLLNEK